MGDAAGREMFRRERRAEEGALFRRLHPLGHHLSLNRCIKGPGLARLEYNTRKVERAEAAFWLSAVCVPAEAAGRRIALWASALQMPRLPIGMETALSMAWLGAKMNACEGTPTKWAPALSALRALIQAETCVSPLVPQACRHTSQCIYLDIQ